MLVYQMGEEAIRFICGRCEHLPSALYMSWGGSLQREIESIQKSDDG